MKPRYAHKTFTVRLVAITEDNQIEPVTDPILIPGAIALDSDSNPLFTIGNNCATSIKLFAGFELGSRKPYDAIEFRFTHRGQSYPIYFPLSLADRNAGIREEFHHVH